MTHLYTDDAELYDIAFDWDIEDEVSRILELDPVAHERFAGSHWEAARAETRLRVDWTDEELHHMTAWTTESWARAVAASPFVEAARYDGSKVGRPPVEPTTAGGLIWQELVVR